jgi:hypothetical protein
VWVAHRQRPSRRTQVDVPAASKATGSPSTSSLLLGHLDVRVLQDLPVAAFQIHELALDRVGHSNASFSVSPLGNRAPAAVTRAVARHGERDEDREQRGEP